MASSDVSPNTDDPTEGNSTFGEWLLERNSEDLFEPYMASSDVSPNTDDPTEGNSTFGEWLLERMEDLLRRAIASELPVSEVASQVLSLIQEWVAYKTQNPDESDHLQFKNETPGAESMGWELWDAVDKLAREDERHHDALIAFINAFLPLHRTQPWQLWGQGMQNSNFLLGNSFLESTSQLHKFNTVGMNENQKINRWVNLCRFVARMTRDTETDFSRYLLWFAREAVEDTNTWGHCDASVLAFEGVVDVWGVHMFRSDADYGTPGNGVRTAGKGVHKAGKGVHRARKGVRKWDGKAGFCKERWLFWETGLLDIARDEARPVDVRDSARRTATKMKSIRDGEIDVEVSDLPSRFKAPTYVRVETS